MEMEEEKKRTEIVMVAGGGVEVMEHVPRNQFSHRRTIRLLRSGMTDWWLQHISTCVHLLTINYRTSFRLHS